MKDLFQNLIWPAAAGNVAWAFFTLAIEKPWLAEGVWARLAVLFLLAIYLGGDWLRTRALGDVKPWYWTADAVHVASIVVFAIAAQLGRDWLEWSLLVVFVVAVLGHLAGAWESPAKKNWQGRFLLAGSNALGPVILFGSYLLFAEPFPSNLPASVAAVLVVWWGVQPRAGRS